MASIRKRGNLQWEARIRRKGYPVACKTFELRADAETWARQVEGEMDRGVFLSRAEAEKTTLWEALERYKTEYVPQLSHSKNVVARVNLLQKRDLASRFLAALRGKDIADYVKERESEGMSANTVRLDLATLSKIFSLAARDWGMEGLTNPIKYVSKPKLPGGRTRRLEGDEEQRLLDACSPKFALLVRFALETAMRREEITNLEWKNVDLAKRFVTLPRTKNGEARAVPLSPVAIDILKEIKGTVQGERVFGLSPVRVSHLFQAAATKAQIVDLHFHDLRHEAVSRFFERTDLDAMEIRLISGHKTLQMLARYTHLRTHRLADRLAGARRGE